MLTSEHTVKAIEQKAKKVMGMLKRGVKFTPTQPNAIAILEKLRREKKCKSGILKGKRPIADGYDLEECNDEIAEMFGVDK